MKVAIITDQHFGARKNSKLFHDYFLKFYENIFFPYLKNNEIKILIDMGDTFDSRKGIDFSSLTWAKKNYFDKLESMGIEVHTIVGNHTAYYKNTNKVNAIDLLLREYKNIIIYSETTSVMIGGLNILLVPWINSENEKETLKLIKKSKAPVCMGHLELSGFYANRDCKMEHGYESNIFDKFDLVFSGHYHTRSTGGTKNNIHYLGNPYEMFWNDVNDIRGFHIFDTETLEFDPVNNPYRIFYKIYYEDTHFSMLNATEYTDKIVKLIVREKNDQILFEKFIDKLYSSGVADLKIVENFNTIEDQDFETLESEDTLSILNRYIEESEIELNKSLVQKIIKEIYQEACEVV